MKHDRLSILMDARKVRDYGIGTYIQSLARHLTEIRPDWEFSALTGIEPDAQEPLPRSWNIVPVPHGKYSIGEFMSLGRMVRRLKPSIFHAPHFTVPRTAGVPTIVTIHDLIPLLFPKIFNIAKRAYAQAMVQYAVRESVMIFTDSRTVKESLLERFPVREEKLRVVPLGVSPEFFAGDQRGTLAQEFRKMSGIASPYLLYLGNVKPHKGLDVLLQAFEVLCERDTDVVLVLAGGDPDEARILAERDAPYANRAGRITVLGRISSLNVKRAYAGAELFIFPSRYEGFGLPALEAMAAGTPVVCADGGALPETVGDAAEVVQAGNVEQLLAAITSVRADVARKESLRARGLARAQEFTWGKTAGMVAQSYADVLSVGRQR